MNLYTVHGVTKVGHNLVTKPYNMKNETWIPFHTPMKNHNLVFSLKKIDFQVNLLLIHIPSFVYILQLSYILEIVQQMMSRVCH